MHAQRQAGMHVCAHTHTHTRTHTHAHIIISTTPLIGHWEFKT